MKNKSAQRTFTYLLLVALLSLLAALLGTGRTAIAQSSLPTATPSAGAAPVRASSDCIPGVGWRWTTGPSQPAAARRAAASLQANGISAAVAAYAYGETDSCGTFQQSAVDYKVTVRTGRTRDARTRLGDRLVSILSRLPGHALGVVRLDDGSGRLTTFSQPEAPSSLPARDSFSASSAAYDRKVYLLIYDPTMSDGRKLHVYMGWGDPRTLSNGVVSSFLTASGGQLSYSIVGTTEVNSEWPLKADGFRYSQSTFLAAYSHNTPHLPDAFNYDAMLSDPGLDVCGRLNRGEIDELWIYGMPYAGLNESILVGPNGYSYNGGAPNSTHGCNKLLPVMGLNYERGVDEALHSFGHRMEATMTYIYGGWEENRTLTSWDRYALDKAQSPNYSYSGCGSVHYTPNSSSDYDYGNRGSVLTNCDDFANYPSLSNPLAVAAPVTCTAWSCTQVGYLTYWFAHLPNKPGCSADTMANDWWPYFVDPNMGLTPSLNCAPPPCPTITGWQGEYWNNEWLQGPPVLCRNDTAIDFEWGGASPDPLLKGDHYSERWTRTLHFDAGYYRFDIKHDDGARLFIDGVAVPGGDFWNTSCTTDSVTVQLQGGDHVVRLEVFEHDGSASAHLWWRQSDILISGNAGIPYANINFTGGSALAGADGSYSFRAPVGWSGTVSPHVLGFRFTPSTITYANLLADQPRQDYTAAPAQILLSGYAGLQGVTIDYPGGSTTTNNNAWYSITLLYGWAGTITPSMAGFQFSPPSRTYSSLYADQADQNYTPTASVTISGNAGVSFATLYYTGGSTIAGADGSYSFHVASPWTGTVTPSRTGYRFDPASRTYAGITADQTGQDYAAPACPAITDWQGEYWNNESLQGAAVVCRNETAVDFEWGVASPSPLINADGFSARWSRTLPFDAGFYRFTIQHEDGARFFIDGSLVTGGDFWSTGGATDSVTVQVPAGEHAIRLEMFEHDGSASAHLSWERVDIAISGNDAAPGATIIYTGGSTTAGADGSYSFHVAGPWTGTVTPSQADTTFIPASRDYVAISADQIAQNYSATQSFASDAAQDGWVRETGELTGKGGAVNATRASFRLGDDALKRQYRSVLSFDTSGLPDNAIITGLKLKLTRQSLAPLGSNPFAILGGLRIDMRTGFFGESAGLEAADFQAAPSLKAVMPVLLKAAPVYYFIVPSTAFSTINTLETNDGVTQMRLRFALDDNNDAIANSIIFYSGGATAAQMPMLIITYRVP